MSAYLADDGDWDDVASLDSGGHVGPWPAFVDLFAASTLILLVFFIVIAYRYIGDVDNTVRVRQLYEQLQKLERGGGQFAVQQQGSDVLLTLEEGVTFRTDEADLLAPARVTLRDMSRLLKEKQFHDLVREIEILGHADRRGNAFRNWQLSARRAVAVAQFLVDSTAQSPCNVIASGRGAYFPRDSTVHPEQLPLAEQRQAYARDRRVEILLHPAVARERGGGRGGCRAG